MLVHTCTQKATESADMFLHMENTPLMNVLTMKVFLRLIMLNVLLTVALK